MLYANPGYRGNHHRDKCGKAPQYSLKTNMSRTQHSSLNRVGKNQYSNDMQLTH